MCDDPDPKGSDDALLRLESETSDARRLLQAAEEVMDDTLKLFDILRDEMREGVPPKEREFHDGLKMVTKARMTLHQELQNYGKSVLRNEGLVADAPLDLDAIRTEIGGRLDRLRATK